MTMSIRSCPTAGLIIMLATTLLSANATVTYKAGSEDGSASIFITGDIVQGDAARFEGIISAMPEKKAMVFLTSPGGLIVESIIIGEAIREHHFLTAAPGICASACGLIWLAGTQRIIGPDSRVGFHAVSMGIGNASVSSNGNAIVGAYLTNMGLSYTAVNYITSAPPAGITWLTTADAQRLGIEYWFMPGPVSATLTAPPIAIAPPPVAPPVTAVRSPEQVAWDELNSRLNLSEDRLRGEVGDAKVEALIVWFKAQSAKDATLLPKFYAQLDPYKFAYNLMSASIVLPVAVARQLPNRQRKLRPLLPLPTHRGGRPGSTTSNGSRLCLRATIRPAPLFGPAIAA
jgi:hypothetical protein